MCCGVCCCDSAFQAMFSTGTIAVPIQAAGARILRRRHPAHGCGQAETVSTARRLTPVVIGGCTATIHERPYSPCSSHSVAHRRAWSWRIAISEQCFSRSLLEKNRPGIQPELQMSRRLKEVQQDQRWDRWPLQRRPQPPIASEEGSEDGKCRV
jgi:hypothetical protein